VNVEERYEGLCFADGAEVEAIADSVLESGVEIEVLSGPEAVTAEIRLSIPGTSATTVVGHVALTTCTVLLGDVRGDGCRPGRDLRGALASAVCDAEVERGGPLAASVVDVLQQTNARRGAEWRQRALSVELTRVEPAA
jgi:alpha-D-ribose 1-methylphosphonate 5-triphosphate synthase subunit PhnG